MRYKSLFASRKPAPARGYFKEGVELVYPDQENGLKIAILPAYDPTEPDNPAGWIPAVTKDSAEESDFYTMVRAAKFVGHGNRRAKVSIVSPQTFDEGAMDPYAVLYEYCSKNDYWSYLTKDKRGRALTGEVEGAILPRQKDFLVCNVLDLTLGARGGVFVTELSEAVAKSLLYSKKKSGGVTPGLLLEKNEAGELRYGDITDPECAQALSIEWSGKGYVAKPLLDDDENVVKVAIPEALLPHRRHMEKPATFINAPTAHEVVAQLDALLRGYHDNPKGIDETAALKEALEEEYGDMFKIDVPPTQGVVSFGGAKSLSGDLMRQLDRQGLPLSAKKVELVQEEDPEEGSDDEAEETKEAESEPEAKEPEQKQSPEQKPTTPGEDINPLDIAKMREALLGGRA